MTDQRKLEKLFRQHYRQMYRLAVMLLHDDTESKDVVHDIFAYLLRSSQDLRENAQKLISFVKKCTKRVANILNMICLRPFSCNSFLLIEEKEVPLRHSSTNNQDGMNKLFKSSGVTMLFT